MQAWAAGSNFYHIVIDRFATHRHHFRFRGGPHYELDLKHWVGGTIKGITRSLDYLHDLGIGALLLSPFFHGQKYHGYWISHPYRVEPHLGSKRDLKELIRLAHRADMGVMMDLPITHCHKSFYPAAVAMRARNSRFRDWFYSDREGALQGFFDDPRLPELNLDYPALRQAVKRLIDYWLALGFDGIRFDHAKRPSPAFWKELSASMRRDHPHVFLLGENWRESGDVGHLYEFLHGELNFPVSAALRAALADPGRRSAEKIIEVLRAQRPLRRSGYVLPTFLDSHDVERASWLTGGDEALLALAYLVQTTLPYPPIIYYGSERGQGQSNNLPATRYERDRYFREPMEWNKGGAMAEWVKRLLKLRNKYIRLFSSEPINAGVTHDGVLSYSYAGGGEAIVVLANFAGTRKQVRLPVGRVECLTDNNEMPGAIDVRRNWCHLNAYSGAIIRLKDRYISSWIRHENGIPGVGVASGERMSDNVQ